MCNHLMSIQVEKKHLHLKAGRIISYLINLVLYILKILRMIFIFQDVTKELFYALNSALRIYLTWYISWSTRRTIHQLPITVESNKGEQNADNLNWLMKESMHDYIHNGVYVIGHIYIIVRYIMIDVITV